MANVSEVSPEPLDTNNSPFVQSDSSFVSFTMSNRSKPPAVRRSTVGGSSLVTVPFGDEEYHTVKFRNARSKTMGGGGQRSIVPSKTQTTEWNDVLWKQAKSWGPEDTQDFALDLGFDADFRFDEAVEAQLFEEDMGQATDLATEGTVKKKGKKVYGPRSMVSKRPHVVWKGVYRDTYLDEICRLAGRGDFVSASCVDCVERRSSNLNQPEEDVGGAIYRCESDCLHRDLVCQDCCVRRHREHPFHRIGKWTGTHFVSVSLKTLGLRVQLNHSTMNCVAPEPCYSGLIILHTNGMHEVNFDFCGCEKAEPRHIQFLRLRLYPASQHVIMTCASFELLNLLHKFSLTTKGSIYDFHRGLESLTDGSGLNTFKSKYRPLLRMFMQWRHLKLLEWGGRAHDPEGAAKTEPGALAIRCSSCAYPGINLPPDFRQAPEDDQFLYRLFGCMDANFRLKNQLVSNYSQDPGLGIGMAYMVPRKGYEGYVLKKASDSDISSCVGFQAIAQANTRFSKGLRYTGVGGVFCGRSEMILPNGIGNLQKGERYCNMDYIFASGVQDRLDLSQILISYDIACQWSVNLDKRLTSPDWPNDIKTPQSEHVDLIYAIPKLHEPMHAAVNHQQYSLNCLPGVGLSDQEAPERVWAGHNAVGNSTKSQGPGSRQDVLDDHFNWWNHLKYISMGPTLLRKYRAALADRNNQQEGHKLLTATVGDEYVKKWTSMCENWEARPRTEKNPYELEGIELSEAEARKALAKAEEEHLAKGGIAVNSTSPFMFISMALDIEHSQRKIKQNSTNVLAQATARQSSGLTEQRNHLRSRIRTWELLLPIYMPGLLQYRTDIDKERGTSNPQPDHPEDWVLWLPSSIPAHKRAQICYKGLPEIEETLRGGQCYTALEALRSTLRLKSRLIDYKNKHVRGQREGTRSRAIIDRVHERGRALTLKYRWARSAKLALSGPGGWETVLKVLEDDDVRTYQEPSRAKEHTSRPGTMEDLPTTSKSKKGGKRKGGNGGDGKTTKAVAIDPNDTPQSGVQTPIDGGTGTSKKKPGTGETRKSLSWIWLMPQTTATGVDEDEILRSEWAKSRARANRASEEVRLLKEEMRRVLMYLSWRKKWWLKQMKRRKVDRGLTEGLNAVATKQSAQQSSLAVKFRDMWQAPLGDFVASIELDADLLEDTVPDELPDLATDEIADAEEEEQEEVQVQAEIDEPEETEKDAALNDWDDAEDELL